MCETIQMAVNSVINWSFFLLYPYKRHNGVEAAQRQKIECGSFFLLYLLLLFLHFQVILSILKVAWQYVISYEEEDWTRDVIEHVTIRLAIGHYLSIDDPLEHRLYLQPFRDTGP